MAKHNDIGKIGEQVAAEMLRRRGFEIIETNYSRGYGEIDIVARYKGVIRFVEVKAVSRESTEGISRETQDYRPEERVDARKMLRLRRVIAAYIDEKRLNDDFQIDVVGVFLDPVRRVARCRLLENVS